MLSNCLVTCCTPLNDSVYSIILQPSDGQTLKFKAGQYLNIERSDGTLCPFSIASEPGTRTLELHIDRHASTEAIIQQALTKKTLAVELPLGECHLPTPLNLKPLTPIILIAASTGYSQMQSILLTILQSGLNNPVHLYWGAKQMKGFYMLEQLNAWQKQYQNFHFTPVLSEASPECQWQDREGLLHQVVVEDFDNLNDAEVFISGSPNMVYSTLDMLVDHGLPKHQAHSDTFSYAPR
jgi:CDP-4-dehydro-6-deoxyglucose reductase